MQQQLELFGPPTTTDALVSCICCGAEEFGTRIELRVMGWSEFERVTSDEMPYGWIACCPHPECRKDEGLESD